MSLLYNVSTLLREPIGSTREFDVADRVLVDMKEPRHEQVAGYASFLRTKDGVLVTARLRGEPPERCSRCLRAVAVPIRLEVEEEFFATVDVRTGAKLPKPDNPDALVITGQQQLDLEEAVRQAWTLALPMQPLCRADCKGLCARCGNDLNEGACACSPEEDDRWSALRKLLVEMEGT